MEYNSRISTISDYVLKSGLYVLAFLLPLFFLPFNANILELNKQLLLVVFALVLLIVWLGKMIATSKMEIKKSFLNIGLILFLIFYLVSSILSKNLYRSLVGSGSGVSESFFSLLALMIIFFLIVNNLRNRKELLDLAFAATLGAVGAGVLGLLQLLGKFYFPWDFTKDISFNSVGSVTSWGIFLAGFLILSVGLFIEIGSSRWRQIFYGLAACFFLVIILSINFSNIWLICLVAVIAIVALGLINREQVNQFRLILPMVILAFSILMLLINFNIFNWLTIPAEISPSLSASFEIDKQAVADNTFFGSGPGNYAYIYGLYRSPDLNLTNFWNIRFNQGFSKILTQPATLGLAGFLIWILIVVGFAIYGFIKLTKNRGKNWVLTLAIFSGWFSLAFAQFIYGTNLTLEFAFWVFLALAFLSLRSLSKDNKEDEDEDTFKIKSMVIEFSRTSPLASVLSFIFVIILVLTISALYLGGNYYYSDILYQRSLKAVSQENNLEKSSSLISQAVIRNPFNDFYLRALSLVASLQINQEFSKPQSVARDNQIQNLIAFAINVAKKSTDLGPLDVENWLQRGTIYRAVMPYASGADQWAVDCYKEATKLEPQNPFYYSELGRSYLLAAQVAGNSDTSDKKTKQEEFIKNAEEAFDKSIALKSDYAPALFQLALLYDLQGKLDEAITKMEQAKSVYSQDTGLAFQLGLLYYKKNNWSAAQAEFERAILLDQNYSNARYFLGLIYDRQGKKTQALEQFEKIAELNPDNSEVKTIVANLRAGRGALVPAQPAELPIKEKEPKSAR